MEIYNLAGSQRYTVQHQDNDNHCKGPVYYSCQTSCGCCQTEAVSLKVWVKCVKIFTFKVISFGLIRTSFPHIDASENAKMQRIA